MPGHPQELALARRQDDRLDGLPRLGHDPPVVRAQDLVQGAMLEVGVRQAREERLAEVRGVEDHGLAVAAAQPLDEHERIAGQAGQVAGQLAAGLDDAARR